MNFEVLEGASLLLKKGWTRVPTGKHKGLWRNYFPDAFYYTEAEALTQQTLQNNRKT